MIFTKKEKQKMLFIMVVVCLGMSESIIATNPAASNNKKGGNWLGSILGTSGLDDHPGEVQPNGNQTPPPPPPNKSFIGDKQWNIPPPPPPRFEGGEDGALNPPPPPNLKQEEDQNEHRDESSTGTSDEMIWLQNQQEPGHWGLNTQQYPNQYWESQQRNHVYNGYPNQWQHPAPQHEQSSTSLKAEIDSLLSHQYELYSQIHNLTHALSESDRKFDIQMNQIDLLLEQVADAEAHASAESNAALEHKANCTRLGQDILILEQKIAEWDKKYHTLETEKNSKDEEIIDLKNKLKKKERELENMACSIEMARLENEREQTMTQRGKKKNQSSGGIFSWLFGWIWDSDTSGRVGFVDSDSESDELEKLQDLARSTLLSALQAERDNVEELEAALSFAQQNNTAIAEMVSSRDSLVDELNDRIAVFEEDKVVLKAALKQLQKEMKDEAPKTAQLVANLNAAKEVSKKLEEKMKSMKRNHTEAIKDLEAKLVSKERAINETDTKMTMISTYVDQLEERLASFSIAKKHIADREVECDAIETKAKENEEKLSKIEKELTAVSEERDELKNLVNLMVEERTVLQSDKDKLSQEKESLAFEGKALREELDLLNDNFLRLEAEAVTEKDQLDQLRDVLKRKDEQLADMEKESNATASKLSEQDHMIDKSITLTMNMQEEIKRLHEEKDRAEEVIFNLEQKLSDMILGTDSNSKSDSAFIPPPPPYNDSSHPINDVTNDNVESIDIGKTDESNEDEKDIGTPDTQEHLLSDGIDHGDSHDYIEEGMDLDLEQKLSDEEHDATAEDSVFDKDGDYDVKEDSVEPAVLEAEVDKEIEPPFPDTKLSESGQIQNLQQRGVEKRNVPFRSVRKTFSRITDMHGVFTPPSSSSGSKGSSVP